MPPFIEAKVIDCQDDKMSILTQLEEKAKNRLDVKISWDFSEQSDPILRVDYESKEAFWKSYTRDKIVYETFVNFLQQKEITIPELFPKKGKISNEDTDLYLILKYSTDLKEPIRLNYNFTYKIVDFMNIQASYEEVFDGFILFYKERKDFEHASLDLMNIDHIKTWLQNNNLWTEIMQDFFKFFD